MFIDFNQIARIGKLVALLGFFLPWVTVSCSNTDILTATGWQLMTGDPQPAGPLANMDTSDSTDDAEPAVIIIVAFAIILIGLVCSLFTKMQAAAITMLVTSVLGIGVSYYGVENMRTELQRQISEGQQEQAAQIGDNPFFSSDQQNELSQAVASNITVKEEEGYIVTHGGLLIAAIFSLLTLFRRRKIESEPAQPSTSPG
ncbi:MAG: hypothetical protein IPL62_06580 [Caulobacteraceae bacterium]|nr:hypothetical protein [Caulobacteraceae bacterium]